MQMLNVTALITGYETVGDHTEFITQISCNGGLWLISRRFSDYDQLHSRLQRSFGDLIEVKIPEKQWFGRFDPNFLAKRQTALQEYLEGLFQVPGILEDRSLQHFLELEKHLEFNGDMNVTGSNGNPRSSHGLQNKSMTLNENDRLAAIVEHAAHTFIDISEVLEPLEADQAIQRKNEIVNASQSLNEQRLAEGFVMHVHAQSLVVPTVSKYNTEMLLSRVEAIVDDGITYEQERDLLQTTLDQVERSLQLTITPPTLSLVALMEGAAALMSTPSSVPLSEGGERESENLNGQPISVN